MSFLEQKLTGLKKRQQIENASKSMFVWVAVASVIVSVCVVASQYFFQNISYNARVISAKQLAATTLSQNITNANSLKTEVDSLVSNQDLASVKQSPSDPNTKSVLDALPTAPDLTELATSLQQAILNRSGVSIISITVNSASATSTPTTTSATSTPQQVPFSIVVNGSYPQVGQMLLDIERTIRPISITSMTMNGQDSNLRVTISAVTYYQPEKNTNVQQEYVR